MYLDHNKVKNAITSVIINGTDTRIAFGSGLSCEELNKTETCNNCKSATESQLFSEQLNCEKTGMFVNKNQKACSNIEKEGIKGSEILKQINEILKLIGENELNVKGLNPQRPCCICIDDHFKEVKEICNILDKYGIKYTTEEEDHADIYDDEPNYDGSEDGIINTAIEFMLWDMNKNYIPLTERKL